ncbi:MAG TPA: FAD-binding oxidoreductase [Candidatus Norongarragalinales archaeon]|jgi:glycine/D-amino acid oxidase-like deaminating enzyme|nr:FAD-binding oxidoreductase [Candidatus Norongarragalinales archaeon]
MAEQEPSYDSPWLESVPDQPRFPKLSGKINTDYCVVGGGIAGVMTAYSLAKKGAKVVLLEKNGVATGDTGYTTAFITRLIDTPMTQLQELYGLDFCQKFSTGITKAQEFLKNTITQEKIDCDFAETPSFTCSYSDNHEQLAKEWQVFQKVDTKSKFIKGKEAGQAAAPIKEAIRFEGEGRFNVRKFVFGLLATKTGKNIQVFESSGVNEAKVNNDVTLKTDDGSVTAKRAILATGKPIDAFAELQSAVALRIGYAIAARFDEKAPIADATFSDMLDPYNYYRRLDEKTIIIGSDREPSKPEAHGEIKNFLKTTFGKKFKTTNAWSGSEFETPDGLPLIATHPLYKGKVFTAMGFDGNGMVQGTMAGMIISDLALGKTNDFARLFDFSRTGTKITKSK